MTAGQARKGFDIDLLDGVAREEAFARLLVRARFEHKRDESCIKTGNLFIEYESRGRPSGIAVTTADWWAFEYQPISWLVLPTDKLKSYARRAYQTGKVILGGDNDTSKGVLVPITWLVAPAEREA